jgi:hypothetical protein
MPGATTNDPAHLEGLARLSKELGRLDPYSFWVVPAGTLSSAADLIVAGATGLFLTAAWPAPGAFSVSRGRPMVDDQAIPGVRTLRLDAKHLSAKLSAASVSATVEPVICLTHGVTGMPRDVKGVHVVALGDLIKDLASRPRILEHSRVERAARVLGVQIAGDRKRHFA